MDLRDLGSKNITGEDAYVLGFMWADGSIYPPYRLTVEIQAEDGYELLPVFLETGPWTNYTRDRAGRKKQLNICLSSKNLVSFLYDRGYRSNFSGSTDILNFIPKELHYMWLRGVIDGDGCFYFRKNGSRPLRQFSLAGRVDQDWSIIGNLLDSFQVRYNVSRKGNCSYIVVTGRTALINLGSFLYPQKDSFSNIGLKRKRNKFEDIKNSLINWEWSNREGTPKNPEFVTIPISPEIAESLISLAYKQDFSPSNLILKLMERYDKNI